MKARKKEMTLPTVEFCGLQVTRLIIGANPFAGFSHQSEQRDQEMVAYYSVDRILETWERAKTAGINTFITNNETDHVVQAVKAYLRAGGTLQWIAQVACRKHPNMFAAVDEAVKIGCCALYFHGGYVDECYHSKDEKSLRSWCEHARSAGIPVGVAGHAPEVHYWVNSLGFADFHAVPFFNCGSLHDGKGERFRLADIAPAIACIRQIRKPCISYKVMGAGRIDPKMAFEHAFANIKPTDVVNVGMHRGDKDHMVEENAALVQEILSSA
jgi:hypothetical protein